MVFAICYLKLFQKILLHFKIKYVSVGFSDDILNWHSHECPLKNNNVTEPGSYTWFFSLMQWKFIWWEIIWKCRLNCYIHKCFFYLLYSQVFFLLTIFTRVFFTYYINKCFFYLLYSQVFLFSINKSLDHIYFTLENKFFLWDFYMSHLLHLLTLYALTGRIRPVLPKFQF